MVPLDIFQVLKINPGYDKTMKKEENTQQVRQVDLRECLCGRSFLKVGEKCGWCGRRIYKSKDIAKN
jgi:hypothetical protein